MKKPSFKFEILSVIALSTLLVGCATTKQTENMLSEAGFVHMPATTDKQVEHLMSLPPDKLTIARINGKAFYVFPDPANKQLYVGNTEQFQTYQQIQTYNKLEGESRVMAVEDEGPGDDTAKWVEWTASSGWTHGTY